MANPTFNTFLNLQRQAQKAPSRGMIPKAQKAIRVPKASTLDTFLNLRKQPREAPLKGVINGNNVLNKMRAEQSKLPKNGGSITNRSTGEKVIASGAKPKVLKPRKARKRKPVQDPLLQLDKLVQEHNDYIYGNDLDDRTIPYVEYFNKNSPSFLDGNERIGEEMKYVQNRLWKLQNDGRYVPDYEDTEVMNDQEFSDYMDKLGMTTQEDNLSVPAIDDLSDQDFEQLLNQY